MPALALCASAVGAQPADETDTQSAQALTQVFRQACIQTEGQTSLAIDWALSQGFEPVDPLRMGAEHLLGGKPGTVMAAPASGGRVLLAAAVDGACSVWSEQALGPAVRAAFLSMVDALALQGARLKPQLDRSIERAGAWRSQLQWRYRRVGGSHDFALSAVTTLSASPGTQLLHLQPQPPAVNHSPDGLPTR